MKKIMFNDKFGLTKAVLEGRKTMTRRIIPPIEIDWNRRGKVTLPISCFRNGYLFMDTNSIVNDLREYIAPRKYQPKYDQGDVVAVAQPYKDVFTNGLVNPFVAKAGWTNKMFVRSEYMPRQIRITAVRVERLQDISDEDCMREGIRKVSPLRSLICLNASTYQIDGPGCENTHYTAPRGAFAALIDKVSGKGTWQSNPWVFVYEFELVKED